ncbi:MAG: cation-translocating P-type ATPase, partial [Coriobacteriia bacterium]
MPSTRPPGIRDESTPNEWYELTVAAALERTRTSPASGLDTADAARRLNADGPNELPPPPRPSRLRMFLAQFNDIMVWLLIAAVLIAAAGRDWVDAVVILTIIVLNAVLGFVQENKAEQAIDALREMSAPHATVIREGRKQMVTAGGLVVGDIVVLAAGDIVPADLRLIEAADLQVDESSLTGESLAVLKSTDAIEGENLVLGDRGNMASLGSTIQRGRGLGLVVATGDRTELGRIAEVASGQEPTTPLQRELKRVGRFIAAFVVVASALVFAAGAIAGRPLDEMFLAAISLAVSAIPEALTAVVTITLGVGVKRMAEKRAIVRKMHSVETLGSTDVIATDKTGTLTLNEMTVVALEGPDGSSIGPVDLGPDAPEWAKRMLRAGIMVNDAEVTATQAVGDPTETALVAAAQRAGLEKAVVESLAPRLHEVAFTSERKMMTTLHQDDEGWIAYTKGAPEKVLRICALDERAASEVESTLVRLASAGLRTLAIAERRFDSRPANLELAEERLELLGVVGMVDPPRPEVPEAIRVAQHAGVRVIMVTGDHEVTARAIASEVGLPEGGQVLSGRDIELMDDDELAEALANTSVVARVDPLHKMRIVKSLQAGGHVVAVTGDGVNDAPALSAADVGIAMGITGTEVAKDASDMVLADDNFATIVAAVSEGRVVFTNLSKFIQFLLSANMSQVLLMFLATVAGLPVPLYPVQLLWTNMATDSLPALALGVDPAEEGMMDLPPRGRGEGIMTRQSIVQIVARGSVLMVGTLGAYLAVLVLHGVPLSHEAFAPQYADGVMLAQTAAFTALVLQKLLFSLTFRSLEHSIFSRATFANPLLLGAIALGAAMQLVVVYSPGTEQIFRTVPLGLAEWRII